MSDPSQHTPDHDAWDAGGHCNELVMVGDSADVCGYVQPSAKPEPEPLSLRDRREGAVYGALGGAMMGPGGKISYSKLIVDTLEERDLFERDEHHTMAELYRYRLLYNAAAANAWHADGIPVVKSWQHHDGEACFGGGWFIVTAQLPTGQVSNHYKSEDWHLFVVPAVDRAPEWDGHDAAEGERRLRACLEGSPNSSEGRVQELQQDLERISNNLVNSEHRFDPVLGLDEEGCALCGHPMDYPNHRAFERMSSALEGVRRVAERFLRDGGKVDPQSFLESLDEHLAAEDRPPVWSEILLDWAKTLRSPKEDGEDQLGFTMRLVKAEHVAEAAQVLRRSRL